VRVPKIPSVLCLCAPAVLGIAIMFGRGAPPARWGVHLGACVLGLALYSMLTRVSWPRSRSLALALALVGVGAVVSTLGCPGIDGIQRWHEVGPLRVHASGLLMPALLVFAAGALTRQPWAAHLLLLGAQAVHLLQPDAGQATAVACGASVLVWAAPHQRNKALLLSLYAISGALAWFRNDDLPPVPFVEDIVAQAFALAPAVGALALVSLALFVLAPLLGVRSKQFPLAPALAIAGYFAGSLIAPRFGEFPVPLLGFGTSPTLGAFLALAMLRRLQLAGLDARALAPAAPSASKDDERYLLRKLELSRLGVQR